MTVRTLLSDICRNVADCPDLVNIAECLDLQCYFWREIDEATVKEVEECWHRIGTDIFSFYGNFFDRRVEENQRKYFASRGQTWRKCQFGIMLLLVYCTYMNLWTFHLCSLRVRTASENIGVFKRDDKRPAWCEGVTLIVGFSSPKKSVSPIKEMPRKENTHGFCCYYGQFRSLPLTWPDGNVLDRIRLSNLPTYMVHVFSSLS